MAMPAETSNPTATAPLRSSRLEEPVPSWSSKQKDLENSFSEVTEQALVQHVAPFDPHVPTPENGFAYVCKQFGKGLANFGEQLGKRVWQLVLYAAFVVPPSIVSGFCASLLLYGIKLATAVRDGTCQNDGYSDFLDTTMPLVACEDIVGAKRWLLFFLPFSGVFVAALYFFLDSNGKAAGGMNTVLKSIRELQGEIERIHGGEVEHAQCKEFKGLVCLRMCPLVYIGTVSTHLFGGSAGREGSALQMAASIFSKYCDALDATLGRAFSQFRLTVHMRGAALVAAIAVGFSGIFGVPVTGAIFAVEVLRVGELTVGEMFTPAVIGAFVADWTCRLVSMHFFSFESHSRYECQSCQQYGKPENWFEPSVQAGLELLAVIPAAFAFGFCGYAFEFLLHHLKDFFGKLAKWGCGENKTAKALMAPFIGGWVVVLIWLVLCLFGSTSSLNFSSTYAGNDIFSSTFAQPYLGLSVYEPGVSISTCFLRNTSVPVWEQGPLAGTQVQPIMWYAFLLKLIFTTVTLGAGFKGGEVTPLFFIGAALGNFCGWAMGQDTQLFSALGFVSVFAAAANTPVACTFMGIELFGGAKTLPFLFSCYIAYLVSNTMEVNGIYAEQEKKPRGGANAVMPLALRG